MYIGDIVTGWQGTGTCETGIESSGRGQGDVGHELSDPDGKGKGYVVH